LSFRHHDLRPEFAIRQQTNGPPRARSAQRNSSSQVLMVWPKSIPMRNWWCSGPIRHRLLADRLQDGLVAVGARIELRIG
jgi:hypothetical protein